MNFVDGLDGLAAGVVGIGAVAFFVFCYQLADLNGVSLATTGALLSAALAGACAGFLPHNFHPARMFMGDSGSMLIGLVLSGQRGHPDRPVLRQPDSRQGAGGLAGQPAADPAAGAAAGLDPDRAVRRPAARRRTPHPRRPVAVRAGQAAPAPPAARDRPLAPSRGADHVAVGRPWSPSARCSPASTPGPWMWISLAAMTAGDDGPHLRAADRPQAPAPGARRVLNGLRETRFSTPPDFVLVFTSTQNKPTTGRPPP